MLVTGSLVVVLSACGTSGRTLRDPAPGATAPPRPTSTTAAVPTTAAPIGLSITSPAWEPGGAIPATFTCDGDGVSPPLTVAGADDSVVELVVVVSAPDDAGSFHWVVAGLDPREGSIGEGAVPPGAVVARNGLGVAAYEPLCPPVGQSNLYDFTVYAFAEPSGITADTPSAQTEEIVSAGSVALSVMTGTYQR
nr:hypothetical protein [Rhabdothermincola salaria]